MVKVPCQEIVMDIIPAIQASLAAELVNFGISQVRVAKALSVAPSAVSQYLSGKRGYRIVFDEEINEVIRSLAEKIRDDNLSEEELEVEFCNICRLLRDVEGCSLSPPPVERAAENNSFFKSKH